MKKTAKEPVKSEKPKPPKKTTREDLNQAAARIASGKRQKSDYWMR
jgi:hypothetical protein